MRCQARLALEGDEPGWVEEGLSDCGHLSRDQGERLDEPVTVIDVIERTDLDSSSLELGSWVLNQQMNSLLNH